MINWDYVAHVAKEKAARFAKLHPNQTIEAAYNAGYMEDAAERESLRAINARLEKKEVKLEAPSMLGSFM